MTEPSDSEQPARSSWEQASSEQAAGGQASPEQTSREQSGRQRSGREVGERERGGRSGGSRAGAAGSAGAWEQRAAGVASEVQRWLIRTSARNVRDELGGQVKKAFRGSDRNAGDSWATATTEPPHAADEAPECAWCPVCRAARRIAQARAAGTDSRGGPRISDAADVMAGAVRDALSGIDSILSYRPGGSSAGAEAPAAPARPERPAADASAGPAGPAGPDGPEAEHADDTAERA